MRTGIRTEFDLHGMTLAEAERKFHELLNEARLRNKLTEVLFITGPGKIQKHLLQLAKEQDLNAYIPLANNGCLVVEIE